jgi:hypothetical protein
MLYASVSLEITSTIVTNEVGHTNYRGIVARATANNLNFNLKTPPHCHRLTTPQRLLCFPPRSTIRSSRLLVLCTPIYNQHGRARRVSDCQRPHHISCIQRQPHPSVTHFLNFSDYSDYSTCIEVAVSLNSNDAQIMSRHGQEWKVSETLSEVHRFYTHSRHHQ